jgi:hypothetical protein
MADSIVGGLFGVSPEQLAQQRQARDYEQQMLAGRSAAMPGSMMSPSLAPFYQQATQEGQLIGRGVGALLGAQDPELQKITQIKQLSSQFDLTTAAGMREFAKSLQQIAPNESMMAAKRADEMAVSAATVTQKTRERQIPTSGLGKLMFERQELLNAGVPTTDPRVVSYDRAIAAEGEGKGTKIIMPTEAQGKIVREKRAGKLLDLEDTALQAADTLQTVGDFNGLLKKAFTGFGAGAKLTAGQVANALGVQVTGTSETEQLNQLFAALTTGQAKNLKGALSDKDLKFLKEAVGTTGLTLNSLQSAINRIEREALIDDKLYELASNYEGDYAKLNLVQLKKQAQQEVNTRIEKRQRLNELRAKQNQ